MLFKMPVERNHLQTVGIKQGHIRDRRLIVGIDEDLEIRLEVKAVLMQEPGVQGIVSRHSFYQRRIEGNLLLGL